MFFVYFFSENHLFVPYFASNMQNVFLKICLIFTTKIYQEFIKNRT